MYLSRRISPAPLSFLILFFLLSGCAYAEEGYFFVEHVIDGDTIVVDNGKKVRYIGMDTPEDGQPFYGEATKRNSDLVGGRRVRLVFCAAERTDRYGRLLAWVYSDGVFVNETLLREGLAKRLPIPPCGLEKYGEFKKAEAEARGKRLGLWSVAPAQRRAAPHGTIAPEEASGYFGQKVRVRGTVKAVKKTRDGVFLDFDGKDGFRAVIFNNLLDSFKSEGVNPMGFEGRLLTVSGLVRRYHGHPEIIVKRPSDIKEE